jgi:Fe-S cluster assembly protein SufD
MSEQFTSFKNIIDNNQGSANYQVAAAESFSELGLPNKKVEAWHYTNPQSFLPSEFEQTKTTSNSFLSLTPSLNFVDGRLVEESVELPEGAQLSKMTEELPSWVTASLEEKTNDSFEILNRSLPSDIWLLKIKKETSLVEPIFVNHHSDSQGGADNFSTKLFIEIETGAKASILESTTGNGFTTPLTHIKAHKNSKIEHVRASLLDDAGVMISKAKGDAARDATLSQFTFTCGGKLTRHNVELSMNEQGAHMDCHGLYALKGEQVADHFTSLRHLKEHTTSNQLYKGILDDSSRGVFTGGVYIAQDAQLVDSAQLNKNLLLSNKAHAQTRPQLEVYADDVKAAHGSTVGQLSEEEKFYLQSRGIDENKAQSILCRAFVSDIIDYVESEQISTVLKEVLESRYGSSLTGTKESPRE